MAVSVNVTVVEPNVARTVAPVSATGGSVPSVALTVAVMPS